MDNRLNLGCGQFRKAGFINVDFRSDVGADVVHDLNLFPYPFKTGHFDHVEADHILEHLDNPFKVMREIHRFSKNGAGIIIRVPHFSRGFSHPEHRRGFDVSFPLYFDPNFLGGYENVQFETEKISMNWFAQKYFKRSSLPTLYYFFGSTVSFVLNPIANLSPMFCSRIWCFWVGGFEEIEFRLRVKK